MGVAKVANNQNYLVKGSLTRQKLQNSKVCRYKFEVNYIPSSLNYNFSYTHIYYIYTDRPD